MNKRTPFIIVVSIAHFFLAQLLFFTAFGMGSARFDSGGEARFAERILNWIVNVLDFPFVYPTLTLFPSLGARLTGLWGYIPFVFNSVLWAFALWFIYRRWPRHSRTQS